MGRPVGYQPDQVLERATELFRTRGFRATSIQDIVDATGLNRFAIYEKFGGKEELFYSVLESYLKTAVKERLLGGLSRDGASVDELLALISFVREANLDPRVPAGCLIINASLELGERDARVEAIAAEYERVLTKAVQNALARSSERGELLPGRTIGTRVEYIVTMLTSVMGLAHVSRELADRAVRLLVAEVVSWRRVPVSESD